VRFEYEPIGAARHYERGLDHDELLLIGDFGGGTSDFSLLRVGPGRARDEGTRSILGNDGVDVAGDAFDGKIVRHCVTPLLGRGAEFVSFFGRRLPVPDWLYAHLERWHHVSMLKSRRTLQLLLDLRREAVEPELLDRLLRVVENDLGFVLHRATEQTKRALSQEEAAPFRIDHDLLRIETEVTRRDFEGWVEPELAAIASCVDGLLARSGRGAEVEQSVLTGGSSLVPAVRRIFEQRFASRAHPSGRRVHLGRVRARVVRSRGPEKMSWPAELRNQCERVRIILRRSPIPTGSLLRSPRSHAPPAMRVSASSWPSCGSILGRARLAGELPRDLADHPLVEHADCGAAAAREDPLRPRPTRARNAPRASPPGTRGLRRRPASPGTAPGRAPRSPRG
jgi:hypothetical protein